MSGLAGGRHAIDWLFLMLEGEDFTARTGYGLGSIWALINSGDYETALYRLTRLIEMERSGEIPPNPEKGAERTQEHSGLRQEWRQESGIAQ